MNRFALFVVLAAVFLFGEPPARAQPTAAAVKAAFLPKFPRYVEWPAGAHPGPRQPFILCVIGRDPFGGQLDRAAASESIDGRSVIVRRMATPDGAAGCHLAYVRGPSQNDTARFLLALRNRPIVTVTDDAAGPQRGIIHFTVSGGRVRFFIDDAEAAERGLSISSRLLALALGVRQRRS